MVNAWKRLIATRRLMVQEMPDQWADVYWLEDANRNGELDSGEDVNGNGLLDPPSGSTSPTRRYAAYKAALDHGVGTKWGTNSLLYESAECLAMIATRGGFAPDAAEMFRADEIGDLDGDGAPEFWDGWGKPIGFFRWAAGFSSIMQVQDATLNPDPLDPLKLSTSFAYPVGRTQTDFALIPLIYSFGPNGATADPLQPASGYQIDQSLHWLQTNLGSTRMGTPVTGEKTNDATVAADNITNHDLNSK